MRFRNTIRIYVEGGMLFCFWSLDLTLSKYILCNKHIRSYNNKYGLVLNLHDNKDGRSFYFNSHMTIVGERVKQIRGNEVQFKALVIVGT